MQYVQLPLSRQEHELTSKMVDQASSHLCTSRAGSASRLIIIVRCRP